MKTLLTTSLLAVFLLLIACSDSGDSINGHGGSGDPYTRRAVGYTLGGALPTCYTPSNYSETKNGNYHVVTCEWYCAQDNTYDDQYVGMTFKQNNKGGWYIDSKRVTGGQCNI